MVTPCLRLGIGQKIRRFPDLEIWAPGTLSKSKTSWKFHQHLLGHFWFFAPQLTLKHCMTPNDYKTLPMGILRDSASSFHWLSSSIFSYCRSLFGCPASVTSPLISTIWCFWAYKPNIFCEDMILATCQCLHIFCCWVEPSLLLSSLLHLITFITW